MEQKIIVTGYKDYSFVDEKTGKKQSGVKVSYLSQSYNEEHLSGNLPIQQSLPIEFLENLKGSGVYVATMVMGVGAGNKPTILIKDLKFVKTINFNDFLN